MFKSHDNEALRITGYIFVCALIVAALNGFILPSLLKPKPLPKAVVQKVLPIYSGIVRLYATAYGTYCTGVVISAARILTAEHCVSSKVDIDIRPADNTELGIHATISDIYAGTHLAILTGDFRLFKPLVISTAAEAEKMRHKNKTMFACGYAMGLELLCMPVRFTNEKTWPGLWRVTNTLIPGMSGGPTILFKAGVSDSVVAINEAYCDETECSAVTPIYDIPGVKNE